MNNVPNHIEATHSYLFEDLSGKAVDCKGRAFDPNDGSLSRQRLTETYIFLPGFGFYEITGTKIQGVHQVYTLRFVVIKDLPWVGAETRGLPPQTVEYDPEVK